MAYSTSDLYLEVQRMIEARSEAGEMTSRGWLVTAILHKHKIKRHDKKNPDDFSICCRQIAVAVAVDRALAKMKSQDEGTIDPDQHEFDIPRLSGYRHLRRVYPVRRDDVIWLVPLDQMTDDEINAKIETYRVASRGFAAHADELARYIANRRRAA